MTSLNVTIYYTGHIENPSDMQDLANAVEQVAKLVRQGYTADHTNTVDFFVDEKEEEEEEE